MNRRRGARFSILNVSTIRRPTTSSIFLTTTSELLLESQASVTSLVFQLIELSSIDYWIEGRFNSLPATSTLTIRRQLGATIVIQTNTPDISGKPLSSPGEKISSTSFVLH